MSTLFHPLRVRSVQPDTDEAVVVGFDVPQDLADTYRFVQGQYLTLRQQIDGRDLRRSYSICAGLDDGQLRIGVRKVPGGVFSSWIHAHLRPGDAIAVMPPQGRFGAPLLPARRRHHVGIAGGSGITPVLSILKTVLAREPLSRFTLIYGNRTLRSMMFREELEDLKNRYLSRLAVHHVFSGEAVESPLGMGLLDRAKVREFLATLVPPAGIDEAYVCGPFQMNDEVEAGLLAEGVPQVAIHVERFGIPPAEQASQDRAAAGHLPGDAEQARVVVVRDGLRRELVFGPEQPSILDCASAAGMDLPFSCTSGVCGTCRAKVLEGEVRMARNFALSPAEVAGGFVLTCQAHPKSERVVLSFDER